MTISGTYSAPVTVNGYSCRSCADVSRAEKHIDPAKPQAGPDGIHDPARAEKQHFSPEARDRDRLEALHRQQARQSSRAANAYGAVQAAVPGQFVNLAG